MLQEPTGTVACSLCGQAAVWALGGAHWLLFSLKDQNIHIWIVAPIKYCTHHLYYVAYKKPIK